MTAGTTGMEQGAVPVRGVRLSFLRWPGDGVPVVFLHGWYDQAAVWLRVAERLGGGLLGGARLALDWRGFGQSAHNPPGCAYAFSEYLADLDGFLSALLPSSTEAPGEVVLVGHSMGGTVASLYAGLRPERVRGLVSVDGLGLADGLEGAADRLLAHLDGQRKPPAHRVFSTEEEAFRRLRQLYPRVDAEHLALLAERGLRRVTGGADGAAGWVWAADARHRTRLALPYRQDQHLQVLERVRCPVLMLCPENPAFSQDDIARVEATLARGPGGCERHTVPGTGHALHVEDPVTVAAAIRGFLLARCSRT